MLLDILNSFTHIEATGVDEQAITADAASTNIIDLGAQYNQSIDDGLYLVVRVGTAFNTLTSLNVILETATTVALLGSAPVTINTTNILLAALTADTIVVRVKVPFNTKRFIALHFDVVGTDPTTGTIQAFLTPSIDEQTQVVG